MESTILLMAPALENSPRPSTKFCSCWLSLAKHFCSMGPFFAPGGLFFFGCSFVNTLKHLYNVDIVLPHLDWLVCLDTLGPSELLPGKRLSLGGYETWSFQCSLREGSLYEDEANIEEGELNFGRIPMTSFESLGPELKKANFLKTFF